MITEVEELMTAGKMLDIYVGLLEQNEAGQLINKVIDIFHPTKIKGHLSINNNSIELPLDEWEFTYMKYLPKEKGYLFFQQNNNLRNKTVVEIGNIRMLGELLKMTCGMEYFLTNQSMDYLIAVNWYGIEIAGNIKNKMKKMLDKEERKD